MRREAKSSEERFCLYCDETETVMLCHGVFLVKVPPEADFFNNLTVVFLDQARLDTSEITKHPTK